MSDRPASAAPSVPLTVTHTSVVTDDQIDHLGHMNVRYYAANARAGTDSLFVELGWQPPDHADVFDMYTRHHREQLLGAQLEVRSGVLDVDDHAIRMYHELANRQTGELAATFVYRSLVPGPPARGRVDTVDVPPHGAPRSLDLDGSLSSPSLREVQDLGLAMRAVRTLDEDDTGGGETVRSHMVPMLIWGGLPPDETEKELVQEGPDGQPVGWATMETRVGLAHLPAIGTRIQSFGATTAMADKTTQMTMWAYDVDSGELLVSFEVVSVLFDIRARRAISIPDDIRAEHVAAFHPDLATTR